MLRWPVARPATQEEDAMTQAVRVVAYTALLPFAAALYTEIDSRLRPPHSFGGGMLVGAAIFVLLALCMFLNFITASLALAVAASRRHTRWVIAIAVAELVSLAAFTEGLWLPLLIGDWLYRVSPALEEASLHVLPFLAVAGPAALILAYSYWADARADTAAREDGQRRVLAAFSLINVLLLLGVFAGAIVTSGSQAQSADPNVREDYYATLFGLYMPAAFCALWLSIVVGAPALVRAARYRGWAWGTGLFLAALPATFLLLSDLFLHINLGVLVPGGDHRGQAQFLASLVLQAPLPIATLAYCLVVRPHATLPIAAPVASATV